MSDCNAQESLSPLSTSVVEKKSLFLKGSYRLNIKEHCGILQNIAEKSLS
jgi:hypothetical protein